MSASLNSSRARRLPERLSSRWRAMLLCGDAGLTVFICLVTLRGEGSRVAAALLAAAILIGVFWQAGLYRRSYAVLPRDEAYFACAGVLFAALPIIVVLSVAGNFSLLSILISLCFCAIGCSALRMRLHLERRATMEAPSLESITPGAWHERESTWFRLGRRCFDLVIASLALVLFMPIMLVAALAIFVESGAPVLFSQERIGECGVPFRILKFRTMCRDAGAAWATPGDERITRPGALLRRTSFDELPQLFNVLRGEMSMVGPRPEMRAFAARFAREIPSYDQRHVVAPGITGWAQLYVKRNLTPEDVPEVLGYDLFYVEHSSMVMDGALLIKSLAEVAFHRAV